MTIFTAIDLKAINLRAGKILKYCLFAGIFSFLSAVPAGGVILHPAGEPNLSTWTDRPHQDVVGRWGNNASCVAVSSNCVVTTRHQGGGTSTMVNIADKEYEIEQIWNHSTADLRLAKLKNANLAQFVSVFADSNEINKELIIGGYGKGRDAILQKIGITYGYSCADLPNTTQRWGTNKVKDYSYGIATGAGYLSDVIFSDFDGLGEGDSTAYEAIIAEYDSGGGWFIKSAGQWKLAGLSLRVQIHYEEGHEGDPAYYLYEAWFRDRASPWTLSPDYLDAVRISRYHQWITDTIPEPWPGDLTGDDWVDFEDFAILASFWMQTDCQEPSWCLGADSEPDGDVDWDDLAFFANHWLTGQ